MSLVKRISFKNLGDSRGDLVSFEENKNVPFSIERVYCIINTALGESRGFHAHKELKQVLICLKGSCDLLLDNGKLRESVKLDSFQSGVFIDSFLWREMHNFSSDCVLLVLASHKYDESDYIRDYSEFLKVIK